MIPDTLLFILGAGASCPFGLPSGAGLRSVLCRDLRRSTPLSKLVEACGFPESTVRNFAYEFLHSGQSSIDAFLARRPDFHDVGLHAIAAALMPSENRDLLYINPDQDAWGDSNWLGYLWQRMCLEVNDPKLLPLNTVAFITFNYDRTVENFLQTSIQYTFNLNPDAAQEIVQEFPIFHMYGDLGDYEPGHGYRFGDAVDVSRIKHAVSRLRVVPNTRPERDHGCEKMISVAKQTVFLGFGFDDMNCHRLAFQDIKVGDGSKGHTAYATSYGMTDAERHIAKQRVSSTQCEVHMMDDDVDCLRALREYASLLHVLA
ncbi:SIR2 family protein [Ramlibacter albus]|uniref:SIR2-like domain-containing protein n=1 Tax=Ramlibacter albus TaxID=2079448 RepID=A0A923MD59_9BURK|nr:SIR2 family protein [Ramlibacter albus]MBC5767229.1 hypothetical protein [Ramlibacter albus]